MATLPTLTIAYARSHTLAGVLIRNAGLTGQRWSHCGMVDHCTGSVVESVPRRGVVETPGEAFKGRYPGAGQISYLEVACPRPETALAWARGQLGKPYDYWAIAGVLLRQSWAETDRWHCAELVERALVAGGRQRFRDAPWYISPNSSYQVI